MTRGEISASDRIRELSDINSEVAAMLQSAGQAIHSLTNRPLNEVMEADEDTQMAESGSNMTVEEKKAAFTQHTQAYYTSLQSVVARLRRQTYALEEAGIIAAEAPALSSSGQQRQSASATGPSRRQPGSISAQEAERITNGGLGNLDVGWLNSRGNKVGAEKESELVEEAETLLQNTLSQDKNGD